MVCKQLEHVIAELLRHVWDKNDWLYEGQHGFRPGYSCESQVIRVCQDIADSLDEGVVIIIIIIIGSTSLGEPWSPQANVASDLYPGHTPANFYNPVFLRLPLPRHAVVKVSVQLHFLEFS